jgi:hypothetical protein
MCNCDRLSIINLYLCNWCDLSCCPWLFLYPLVFQPCKDPWNVNEWMNGVDVKQAFMVTVVNLMFLTGAQFFNFFNIYWKSVNMITLMRY